MRRDVSSALRVMLTVLLAVLGVAALADDWPEFLGAGRTGEWRETGILRKFPEGGPKVLWRTPICPGYSGPAVADGRVFVSDCRKTDAGRVERVVCLDEQTGQVRWVFENTAVDYAKLSYDSGPRATPTVDGDRVYCLGAAGDLYCLKVESGSVVWQTNLRKRFNAKLPIWGFSGAPLVAGDRLICVVGGTDNSLLVGLDKLTGEEAWRALPATGDIAYAPPRLIDFGGRLQCIHQVPGTLSSVDPQTGEVLWRLRVEASIPLAPPVWEGDRLFLSDFWKGSTLARLTADKLGAEVLWHRIGTNEVKTDALHCLISTPVIKDGYIYGVDSYGQLRCLVEATGDRVWESMEATVEKVRNACAVITRNHDAFFLNNDRGELIIADLQPTGYRELSRTKLIKPTSGGAGTRQLKQVNWVYPAYANRCILVRNDEEILRVSLAAEQ